jgi:hypothetical protein
VPPEECKQKPNMYIYLKPGTPENRAKEIAEYIQELKI